MPVHLQREIEKLKKQILVLGTLVEDSLRQAVTGIEKKDEQIARTVINDDNKIDQMEVEVEEECLKIIALHQPVAIDLRFIIAVLKINNDLERIGDLASNISKRAIDLIKHNPVVVPEKLYDMVDKSKDMVKNSLDALVNMDTRLANHVCEMDDAVDDLNQKIYREVEQDIHKNPENLESLINILSVSRCLERIADHATNIAEDVIYMIEGKVIRHTG